MYMKYSNVINSTTIRSPVTRSACIDLDAGGHCGSVFN
jgi:hypothetical protein